MDGLHSGRLSNAAEPSATAASIAQEVEVPDPDEDDLDDLDGLVPDGSDALYLGRLICNLGLLDEFSSSNVTTVKESSHPMHALRQSNPPEHKSAPTATDDFNRQLEAQMAALMGDGEETPEMRAEIQGILQELSAVVETDPSSIPPPSGTGQAIPLAAGHNKFQDAILKTMQRMQDSGNRANAEAAVCEDSEDMLAQMLKDMQDGDSSASAGEPEISKMLMTMMEQLTNRDILYDPMKELNDKFPAWMSCHKSSTEADDLVRYEKQQQLITDIVGKFEESTYSDSNPKDREYIVERMQAVGLHDSTS